MKRSVEQLGASLKQRLAPVYLITGDEPLQRLECADVVRAAARAQGYDERIVFDSDTGIDWAALRLEADSLSLFSTRRFIEIRLQEAKVGAEGGEALRAYCRNVAQDVLLLIDAPKFDGRIQQSEWYKAIDAVGEIIAVWPIKAEQMSAWITRRLAARGLSASGDARRLLADLVEGNLLAAAQDIDKLALLAPAGTLEAGDILAVVGDSARYDLFVLADTALAGDAARVLRMLRGLRDEGAEPVLLCWSLTRELRAASLLAAGTRPDTVIPGYRLFPPREAVLDGAVRRLGTVELRRLLRQAISIDRIIKGAAAGDPWSELTTLCLCIAGAGPQGDLRWIH
ncbi:MAG: DNA polymerase III subunit delta [Chromatiales bacterium]